MSFNLDELKTVYLTEVLDNEQGKEDIEKKEVPVSAGLSPKSTIRVKEAVYKIKQMAQNHGVSVDRAYYDYMAKANFGGLERNAIKDKLGVGSGTSSVKEEVEKTKRSFNIRENARQELLNRAVGRKNFGWETIITERIGLDKKDAPKDKEIKEKIVNNTVTINPKLESLDVFTDYLLSEGLNEYGIESLIEEMGDDEFSMLFEDFDNQFLIERKLKAGETSLPAKTREKITGKAISRKNASDLKGGAASAKERSDSTRRTARSAVKSEAPQTQRQKTLAKLQQAQRSRNIEKAKVSQPSTTSTPTQTKQKAKGLIGKALDRAKQDTNKVLRTAGTVAGATVGAAKFAHRAGQEFGKSKTGQAIKGAASAGAEHKSKGGTWAGAAGRAAGTLVRKLKKEGYEIDETLTEEINHIFFEMYQEAYELEEKKNSDPCWKNYKQQGVKDKEGKIVPNCIPEEVEELDEGNKEFPYSKVGNKLRSLDNKIKTTKDPKERNKLSKRSEKIGNQYWLPEKVEELDELKIPQFKDHKGAGEKAIKFIKNRMEKHDDAVDKFKNRKHDKELKRRYQAITASFDIGDNVISEDDVLEVFMFSPMGKKNNKKSTKKSLPPLKSSGGLSAKEKEDLKRRSEIIHNYNKESIDPLAPSDHLRDIQDRDAKVAKDKKTALRNKRKELEKKSGQVEVKMRSSNKTIIQPPGVRIDTRAPRNNEYSVSSSGKIVKTR